jgi:hypothetical protein
MDHMTSSSSGLPRVIRPLSVRYTRLLADDRDRRVYAGRIEQSVTPVCDDLSSFFLQSRGCAGISALPDWVCIGAVSRGTRTFEMQTAGITISGVSDSVLRWRTTHRTHIPVQELIRVILWTVSLGLNVADRHTTPRSTAKDQLQLIPPMRIECNRGTRFPLFGNQGYRNTQSD